MALKKSGKKGEATVMEQDSKYIYIINMSERGVLSKPLGPART